MRFESLKCVCGWGTALDPTGGAYSTPPNSVAALTFDSCVWDAFDQVIQGSKTSETTAASDPAAASVDANRAAVMQMIRVYIADPTIDRMSDPLKWWADSGAKKLALVARKFLCPLATSVPSERLFSGADLIHSDRRSRLAAEKADKLLFIHRFL